MKDNNKLSSIQTATNPIIPFLNLPNNPPATHPIRHAPYPAIIPLFSKISDGFRRLSCLIYRKQNQSIEFTANIILSFHILKQLFELIIHEDFPFVGLCPPTVVFWPRIVLFEMIL